MTVLVPVCKPVIYQKQDCVKYMSELASKTGPLPLSKKSPWYTNYDVIHVWTWATRTFSFWTLLRRQRHLLADRKKKHFWKWQTIINISGFNYLISLINLSSSLMDRIIVKNYSQFTLLIEIFIGTKKKYSRSFKYFKIIFCKYFRLRTLFFLHTAL